MSAAETVYTVRVAFPNYLQRARRQLVTLPLYRDGALAAPTASGSTFALYSPDGQLLKSGSVSVAASVAGYQLEAADLPSTLNYGHGYREEWTLVCADGVTRTFRRDAAVVKYAAYPVVTDDDLLGVYSDLKSQLKSGTTTFQAYIDEAWKRILGRLEAQSVFPEKVVTSWSLREVHIELTLYGICMDFHRKAGGRWIELAAAHKKEFEMAWGRLVFTEGDDEGNADTADSTPGDTGVVYANASPRSTWRGSFGIR